MRRGQNVRGKTDAAGVGCTSPAPARIKEASMWRVIIAVAIFAAVSSVIFWVDKL